MIKVTFSSDDPDGYKKAVQRTEAAKKRTIEKIKKSGLPFSTWGVVVDGNKVKSMDVAD